MLQIFTMINNGHKAARRYMMFLVVLQITVIVLILTQPEQNNQNIVVELRQKFWREPEKHRAGAYSSSQSKHDSVERRRGMRSAEVTAAAAEETSRKVEYKLELNLVTQNLPQKKEYLNGSLAFPNNRVPPALHGWSPSNESYRYFQPMEGKDAWIYSAFFVESPTVPASILAIGLARNPVPWRIYCHFHLDGEGKFKTQAGHMKKLPEHHKTTVVPVFLECNVPNKLRPKFVSFTFADKTTMKNSLPIQYEKPRSHNFTVCYAALHSNFSLKSQLVWSIEMNRIMGAEHFYVYNFSISSQVDTILRHYSKVGLVTVMQWPVPTLESWYIGQMAVINDCLYRNRKFSKFVAFVDTDELIMPKSHPNWKEMIKAIEYNPTFQEPTTPKTNTNTDKKNSDTNDAKTGTRALSASDKSKTLMSYQSNVTSNQYQNRSVLVTGLRRLMSVANDAISKTDGHTNSSRSNLKHAENKEHRSKSTQALDKVETKTKATGAKEPDLKKDVKTVEKINTIYIKNLVTKKDPKENITTSSKKLHSLSSNDDKNSKQEKMSTEISTSSAKLKSSPQENKFETKLLPTSSSKAKSITRILSSNPKQTMTLKNLTKPGAKISTQGQNAGLKTSKSTTSDKSKGNDSSKKNTTEMFEKKTQNTSQSTNSTEHQKRSNSSSIVTPKSKSPSSIKKNSTTPPLPPIGSFLFRNIFYSYKHTDLWASIKSEYNITKTDEEFIRKFRISPLLHYLRYDKPFPARNRSKMIIRPDLVRIIGIHYVYEHTQGARSAHVATEAAMLHHYRGYDHEHSNTITDSAFRFKSNLIKRLRERFTNFPSIFKT